MRAATQGTVHWRGVHHLVLVTGDMAATVRFWHGVLDARPAATIGTGPAPARERQREIERRFGLRIVCGYAMSETPYGLIWPRGTRPFGTLGAPRQHPRLGTVNEARVVAEDGLDYSPP